VTGQYYNFSNIPFATPPLGELRFAAPTPPKTNRSAVNTGVVTHICFQQIPAWFGIDAPPDPRESEDCLYLDVMVPKRTFDGSLNGTNSGAPVLVWVYGGGYILGDKQEQGDPAGLLAKATAVAGRDGDEGVIWVAINYRVRISHKSARVRGN
jgi:carboxylesterase type B